MDFTADRELTLSRAYEHALRSAYAHGSALTDFSFALPQPDDVLLFPNGNKSYRKDTSDSGYSDDEQSHYDFLLQNISVRNGFKPFPALTIPSAFLADADTILESHLHDLSEIARGFIRANVHGDAIDTFSNAFSSFSRASLAFHESLLFATEALFRIHDPRIAAGLIQTLFPVFLENTEQLIFSARRFAHPQFFTTLQQGVGHQLHDFLIFGQELHVEKDFFNHQLHTLTHDPYTPFGAPSFLFDV